MYGAKDATTKVSTADPRQTVHLAYVFLLGRPPESDAVVDMHLQSEGGATVEAMRRRIVGSEEFRSFLKAAGLMVEPAPSIGPVDGLLGAPLDGLAGFFTDRFGVRTRVSYLPASYLGYSGKVGSPDGTFDIPLHEAEEMNALLRSVSEAKGQFVAMELGAGWGPWIVLGAHLARRRGLPTVLTGVEGSSDHVGYMLSHLADNGLDSAAHQIIHAVAGSHDGVAYFPKLPDPSADWGAEAKFDAQASTQEMEEVPCVSLRTLLDRVPVLDLLHCDVQGAEADVLEAAIDAVDQRVRRICIGTHGRAVEAALLDLIARHGWVLEVEKPCGLQQQDGKMVLIADGVQVWRNPRNLQG